MFKAHLSLISKSYHIFILNLFLFLKSSLAYPNVKEKSIKYIIYFI